MSAPVRAKRLSRSASRGREPGAVFTCRCCGIQSRGPTAAMLRADIARCQAQIDNDASDGTRYGLAFAWGYARASLDWAADALDGICAPCGSDIRAGKKARPS